MSIVSPLQVISNLTDKASDNFLDSLQTLMGRNISHADLVASLLVSPIYLQDRKLSTYEHLSGIIKACTSINAAYYCQAFTALTAGTVNGIKVTDVFDKLNPNKRIDLLDIVTTTESAFASMQMDTYRYGLPFPDRMEVPVVDNQSGVKVETITSDSSMGVGKVVEVSISKGEKNATFPVIFRPSVGVIDSNLFRPFIELGGRNLSFSERAFQYSVGEKSLMELLFLTDVTHDRRKIMMNDKSGHMKALLQQRENMAAKTLLAGNKSYGIATAVAIVDSETVRDIELGIGGAISNPEIRKRIFEKTLMLFMVIIDTETDVATIYYRDIPTATEVNVKDFINAKKAAGSEDLSKLFQALMAGRAPTF